MANEQLGMIKKVSSRNDWTESVLTVVTGFLAGFSIAVCLVLYPMMTGSSDKLKKSKSKGGTKKTTHVKEEAGDIECSTGVMP